ncbi:GNAT family N-acetyltransferase [Streptomyces sp. NPDC005899]|uniref:GNAT family N-acetyltransferase n=1 Tax=Streptomyces sp. NPDC005899 TaxID=3155716 RepID=UPI0034055B88
MDNLVTRRLILHPLTAAAAEAVERGCADGPPPGARWAPGYPTAGDRAAVRRYLEACTGPGGAQPFGPYEIRRRSDGLAIGGVGFHGGPDATGRVTVGFGLVRSARGLGYASEALRALLSLARSEGVTAVTGDAELDNIGSQRVMTSVGMRLVASGYRLRHYRLEW